MPASGQGFSFDLEWRTTLFTLVAVPLLTWLGVWQLQRADEKASIAATWEARQSQPPAPLGQLWEEPADRLAYKPVALSGVLLEEEYFLLDNRMQGGRFGYEVLAIMRLDAGAGTVLVNRGWVPADPARQVPPSVPSIAGPVELTGHIYVAPGTPYLLAEQQVGSTWPQLLQAVEMDKIRPMVEGINGERMFPYPIRIDSGQRGALAVDWQLVNVSPEKHGAYAAQWFTMALVLLIFFVLRSSNIWQLLKPSAQGRR